MSKKPLVSIVCITYNHQDYISKALKSFINQKTDFTIEVIVADDASTDKSQAIIAEFQSLHPETVKPILRKKNVGAVKNFIEAIQQVKGDFVAICDGDDYWIDEHKLQKQVDYLLKHKDKALCFNPTRVVYQDGSEDGSIWPSNITNKKYDLGALLNENFIPMNSVMYRRQDYAKLADDVMPFDWYLHLFHARYGGIGLINDAMSVYRRHKNGLWWESSRDPVRHWKAYGAQTLNLLQEVEKMYKGHRNLENFISKAVEGSMVSIARAHQQDSESFGRKVVNEFGDYALDTIVMQHDEIMRNQETINTIEAERRKLEDDIAILKSDNFKLKADLQDLRGSRVIGKIIATREKAGRAIKNNGSLPLFVVSKTKHAVSKVSPEFIKPVIRTSVLRPARMAHRLRNKKNAWNKYVSSAERVRRAVTEWNRDKPLVSIIVPYYNRADTIDATLTSLQQQTFQDFETIIVNDGSTDQVSIDRLAEISKQHPFVAVKNQDNHGVAVARNNGIKAARGKYIICLDSDDIIEPTYIEKCTAVLEANPDTGIITTYKKNFGVSSEAYHIAPYNPLELFDNNMVITAAQFRKEAWEQSGGYTSDIGYEDWEYWLKLAEHGFWGKLIPEELFNYRVALSSRFTEDKEIHWSNIKKIHQLHHKYKSTVKSLLAQRKTISVATPETAFVNISKATQYTKPPKDKRNILITLPWMTFGGAESLVVNFCSQMQNDFNVSFMTGLKSEHEWEYKFREITPNIYHLANLFDDPALQIEFVSNYISTRKIDTLHIVHHGVLFPMLPEIKKRHPKLRVIVTMFNDVAEQFSLATNYAGYIDEFTSDNAKVINHYRQLLGYGIKGRVIPNGIDCSDVFRLDLFDREAVRKDLALAENDLAIFFVGRLSSEKNPDVFVRVAHEVANKGNKKARFFIVGDGGMRPEIESLITELKVTNITYLGYQSDVAHFMSAADVFVLPSSAEGFPLTMIEAMAMRVVVVASDVGAVAEVLENGYDGYVVAPGSVEEITEAILSLSGDSSLLNKMKKRSRQKVEEKYSILQLGKNYTNLYKGDE